MLPKHAATRYTPRRVNNGDGTFTESISGGTTMYGVLTVHEAAVTFIVHRYTDARVDDILVVDDAQYRVLSVVEVLSAPLKNIGLERMDRPIVPRVQELGS